MTIYRWRSIGNAFSAGCSAVFIFHRYRCSSVACMEIMVSFFSCAVAPFISFPFFSRGLETPARSYQKTNLYCIIKYALSNTMGSTSNCFQGRTAANSIVPRCSGIEGNRGGNDPGDFKIPFASPSWSVVFSFQYFFNYSQKCLLANSTLPTPVVLLQNNLFIIQSLADKVPIYNFC